MASLDPRLLAALAKWKKDPEAFVLEAIGAIPTKQQRDALLELKNLVNAKVKQIECGQLTAEERGYTKKVGISIMSGKGTGKDAFLAWIAIWFKLLYPSSKFPIISPTYEQGRDIFMAEFSKWVNRRNQQGARIFPFADMFEIGADRISLKKTQDEDVGFIRLRTAPRSASDEVQKDTLGGWHNDYMMILVDEASGVPEPVFKAFDSTLTSPVNFVVMCFNPNRTSGYAYETHYGKSVLQNKWIKLQWDSRDSENVSKGQIENYKDMYGENSPEYRINILGLPPESHNKSLVSYQQCLDAVDRELDVKESDPVIFGVDVARYGDDSSVICVRQGNTILEMSEYRKMDTSEMASWILMKAGEHDPAAIYIDVIGVGAGVYDQVKPYFQRVYPVDVNTRTTDGSKYNRLRDELFWLLRKRFELGLIKIPDDRKLINELSGIEYDIDDRGKVKVETKKQMKARGMASPNHADALMISMRANDMAMKGFTNMKGLVTTPRDALSYGWMGV